MTMRVSLLSNIIFVNSVKLPKEDLDLNIISNIFSIFSIFV